MKEYKIGDKVWIKSSLIPNFDGTIIGKTEDGQYVIDSEIGGKLTMPATAFYLKKGE